MAPIDRGPSRPPWLLITCEHAGNRVPADLRRAFAGARGLLRTHRAFDAGALVLARDLARTLRAPLECSLTSRLVVDLNRSLHHHALLSRWTRALPVRARERILRRYYQPHRARVEGRVARAIAAGQAAIHISIHSFTPVLRARRRTTHVGFLFDPARPIERAVCAAWRRELQRREPRLTLHLNRPYRGTSDGLTTHLRTRFGPTRYAGIELEVNQRLVRSRARWRRLRGAIAASLVTTLDPANPRPAR